MTPLKGDLRKVAGLPGVDLMMLGCPKGTQ